MTSLKKHPDYLEESRRLKSTIQYMDIYSGYLQETTIKHR